MPQQQHGTLVAKLNKPGRARLDAMWEAVFLHALNQSTPIRFEEPLFNGRRPDFALTFPGDGTSIEIVGDITTASDQGLDANNPVRELGDEITRLAQKHGLDPHHFRYQVASRQQGEYPKMRVVTALPGRDRLRQVLKENVEPFIMDLASRPREKGACSVRNEEAEFTVSYDRRQEFAGGGYPSYQVAYSLRNNPIYPALRAKADQLRSAPADAIRLVILCDAGCYSMKSTQISSAGSYTGLAIARDFLRDTSSVDLVMLVSVGRRNQYDISSNDFVHHYQLAAAPLGSRHPRLTRAAISAVESLLGAVVTHVPTPIRDAANAVRHCNDAGFGSGLKGGYTMNGKRVRISSRAVQELLAGSLTQAEFDRLHGWDAAANPRGTNPFASALERGQTFSRVTHIAADDKDDDWLEFQLEGPDPAISPFVATQ